MSLFLLWHPRRLVAGAGTITGGDRAAEIIGGDRHTPSLTPDDFMPVGGDRGSAYVTGGDRRSDE